MTALTFQPVLLWTDALLFLLVAAILVFAWYVRRREHLRAPWRKVAQSRRAVISALVLGLFVLVGLLDSLHFRRALPGPAGAPVQYDAEVLSAFDLLVGGLRTRVENSYSAPLAAYAYGKETVEQPDGSMARVYPRLQHGASHLRDPAAERLGDLAARSLAGLGAGALVWLIAAALLSAGLARHWRLKWREALTRIAHGATEVPWREVLLAGLLVSGLAGVCVSLSGPYHLFGTDKVGLDVLYAALKSIRTGLVIGTITTLVMLPFALALGIAAGYFGGWVDDVIQYIYTTLNSIPGVLLIAAAVLMVQVHVESHPELFTTAAARADLRLLFLCLILGVTSWTGLCRLLRGEALKLRELDYVQAARAFGVGHGRILTRHLLPNVMHLVLITVVIDFSGLVLAEAVLSYVGVGVDPTMFSWGNMINSARLELAREPVVWWQLAAAFTFMFVIVLAANLFADSVRDAFDPRARNLRPGRLARVIAARRREPATDRL